ncbi:hypothetical protein D3C86_2084150 [compost metagenome]
MTVARRMCLFHTMVVSKLPSSACSRYALAWALLSAVSAMEKPSSCFQWRWVPRPVRSVYLEIRWVLDFPPAGLYS